MDKKNPSNTVNMHGGIYINNIEYIEHFHAPTDNSTDNSSNPTQVNNNLVVQESIISELLPIFMNNREAAAEFLQDIREAKPTDITKRVKLLVKEGTISEEMSHKDLYDILFKYHYYDRTLQNWNSQL